MTRSVTLKWELLDVVSYHFSQVEEEDNIPLKLLKSYDGTQVEDCAGKTTDNDILPGCIEEMELRWSHYNCLH